MLKRRSEDLSKPAAVSTMPAVPMTPVTAVAPAPTAPPAPPGQDKNNGNNGNNGNGHIPPKRRTTPRIAELRRQIRAKLLAAPDEADEWKRENPDHVKTVVDRLRFYLQRTNIPLSPPEFDELRECILDDLLGYGAIDPLIRDKSYNEIMVNGPDIIFAERKGKMMETEYVFDDDDHADWAAQRVVRRLLRRFDRENPMTDARLPDGSRVHLIRKPAAIMGTTITIRKFPEKMLTVEDMVNFGSFPQDVADFLEACTVARLNTVVSGGTGSGKTTLLNVLSAFIPESERIVTIEDSAELQLMQRHVVRLETAAPIPGAKDGTGRVTVRDLVKGSLRMRPDRIVIGEIRDGAALDMLQAMNTGHDGSLTTVHSNSPRDAVARLETLTLMAGMDLPVLVIRKQIASAVQLFVQQARLKDGSRKVTQITELQGMEGDNITLQDIFVYRTPGQTSHGPSHEAGGKLEPTGFRPKFEEKLMQFGHKLPARMFGAVAPQPNNSTLGKR